MNPFRSRERVDPKNSSRNTFKALGISNFGVAKASGLSPGISAACILSRVAFPFGFSGRGRECVRKCRSRIDTPVRVTRCRGEKQRGAVSTSRTCPAVHSRKRERACVWRQNTLVINANRKRRCEELNLSELTEKIARRSLLFFFFS